MTTLLLGFGKGDVGITLVVITLSVCALIGIAHLIRWLSWRQ